MGAKISVLGMIMSFPLYLRSAMVWFPLMDEGDCKTAPATSGLLIMCTGSDPLLFQVCSPLAPNPTSIAKQ